MWYSDLIEACNNFIKKNSKKIYLYFFLGTDNLSQCIFTQIPAAIDITLMCHRTWYEYSEKIQLYSELFTFNEIQDFKISICNGNNLEINSL